MPSALTMLHEYQRQLAASRGMGMAGVSDRGRLQRTIGALLDVVNADYDPRIGHDVIQRTQQTSYRERIAE